MSKQHVAFAQESAQRGVDEAGGAFESEIARGGYGLVDDGVRRGARVLELVEPDGEQRFEQRVATPRGASCYDRERAEVAQRAGGQVADDGIGLPLGVGEALSG